MRMSKSFFLIIFVLIIFVLNRTKFKNSMLVEECYTLCMLKIERVDCVYKRHKISKI